jgi:hypothetical protein
MERAQITILAKTKVHSGAGSNKGPARVLDALDFAGPHSEIAPMTVTPEPRQASFVPHKYISRSRISGQSSRRSPFELL